ncbi:MAG: hypothetical protein K2Q07_10265, partial [Burkholderiaceae bacterium]|nr:hypothetical protein [Burkholderiaceae bacterium]
LRAVPGRGVGYGLLRYLNPTTAPTLAGQAAPAVSFNYLGRLTVGHQMLHRTEEPRSVRVDASLVLALF